MEASQVAARQRGDTVQDVFKRKIDEHGNIGPYKTSLVANGYFQKSGVDYDNSLAPVVWFDVLLLLVGRFFAIGWHVHHADILTDF